MRAARQETCPTRPSLYVSPLKALSNDIHKNLEFRWPEIPKLAAEHGYAGSDSHCSAHRRHSACGTAADDQEAPHILVTTPESLYILLTAEGSRKMLREVRTIIVDEIHAVADDKRGSHLALTLARLDELTGRRCSGSASRRR